MKGIAVLVFSLYFAGNLSLFAGAPQLPEYPEDFNVIGIDGTTAKIDFKSYHGKPLVIYFWSIEDSRKSSDDNFVDFLKFSKDHPKINMLAIHFGIKHPQNDFLSGFKMALQTDGFTNFKDFVFVHDGSDPSVEMLADKYLIYAMPYQIFVDASGKIASSHVGYMLWGSASLKQYLLEISKPKSE